MKRFGDFLDRNFEGIIGAFLLLALVAAATRGCR